MEAAHQVVSTATFHLPMKGAGPLLHPDGEWRGQPQRRVLLPGAEPARAPHQRSCGVSGMAFTSTVKRKPAPRISRPAVGPAGRQDVNRRADGLVGHGRSANRSAADPTSDRLPVWRIGITGAVVGILCCVGPTILGLLGIISAATAFAWGNNLYDNYAWWFRLGGLALLAALIWISLRHRHQCSIDGIRGRRTRLLAVVIAAGTYVVLYGVTSGWARSSDPRSQPTLRCRCSGVVSVFWPGGGRRRGSRFRRSGWR